MSFYETAASRMLDMLWDDKGFREHCHLLGADLVALGHLIAAVFVPAYVSVKSKLDPHALMMIEAQITEDLLTPFYDRPGFHAIWDRWDSETRDTFIKEQSEAKLAELLINIFFDEFAEAYLRAYEAHRAAQGA